MNATLEHPATRGSTFIGSPTEAGRYTVANATVPKGQRFFDKAPGTLASPIRTGPPDIIRTTRGLGRI